MIFYFTGTGNSLFAAKRLLANDEQLVNIADAINNNEYEYRIKPGENVGLVFPVYFYTVPTIVGEFISKLKLHDAEYIYSVITCGGGISQADAVLKKMLSKNGYTLDYATSLLMPDNSMLFYQIPSVAESRQRLDNAEKVLTEIGTVVSRREKVKISNATVLSDIVGAGYKLCSKTAKFYADEKCIGCHLCESICPQKVIAIKDGKPSWDKSECSKCSACINRCPKNAIQYGSATEKRNRYVNPEM